MSKFYSFLIGLCFLFASCAENETYVPANVVGTLLVYMDADNSLTANVEDNLDSLAVGYQRSSAVGNLLVYVDDMGVDPVLYHFVKKDGAVEREVLKQYEEWTSTDPAVMRVVLTDAFSAYSSSVNTLVLWSHALSWLPATRKKMSAKRSWGSDNGYQMDITDLAAVFQSLPAIHIQNLIFDACYMSSIEVAYELRNSVDYIVASPAEIFDFGFPYQWLVPAFFENPLESNRLAECYASYYDGTKKPRISNGYPTNYRMDGTIALIKCSALQAVAEEVQQIVSSVSQDRLYGVDKSVLQPYFRSAEFEFCYDFLDYFQQIATPTQYTSLETVWNQCVLYKHTTSNFIGLSIDPAKFSGVATYVVQSSGINDAWDSFYPSLEWSKDSGIVPLP